MWQVYIAYHLGHSTTLNEQVGVYYISDQTKTTYITFLDPKETAQATDVRINIPESLHLNIMFSIGTIMSE
jgi:hypothetical protein